MQKREEQRALRLRKVGDPDGAPSLKRRCVGESDCPGRAESGASSQEQPSQNRGKGVMEGEEEEDERQAGNVVNPEDLQSLLQTEREVGVVLDPKCPHCLCAERRIPSLEQCFICLHAWCVLGSFPRSVSVVGACRVGSSVP